MTYLLFIYRINEHCIYTWYFTICVSQRKLIFRGGN